MENCYSRWLYDACRNFNTRQAAQVLVVPFLVVITAWAHLLGLFHQLLGRTAHTQHDSNASICLPDPRDLIFGWLYASSRRWSASISACRHASVLMYCSYVQIFSCCLQSSPYNILPLGSIFISWGAQRPGSTFTYVKCPIERKHSGIRQTISFRAPSLNTAGLARERCRSRRHSSRRGPSPPELLHVALSSRSSAGAAGNSASSSASFSSQTHDFLAHQNC